MSDVVTLALSQPFDEPAPPAGSKLAAKQRAMARIFFTVIEDRQFAAAAQLAQTVAQFVAKTVAGLLGGKDGVAAILADPAKVADIEFSTAQKGKLKAIFIKSLAQSFTLGRDMAMNEIDRAKTQHNSTNPMIPVSMSRQSFDALREQAAAFFDANAFRMAGNVSDAVRAIIQAELQNAIKAGKSPAQTSADIWAALASKGMTSTDQISANEDPEVTAAVLADLGLEAGTNVAAYLDTLSRTNLFEAMNEARFAEFTDPALGGFVEALEYSAILDERTTDICLALDGSIFNADNPLWDTYRPPNHYNCRSILVPITTVDGWDGTESDPPTVEPQDGFK